MATECISIHVDPEAAQAYNSAPPADRRKIEALLSLWLRNLTAKQPGALKDVMDRVGQKAREKGISAELLERLLKEA